MRIYLLFSSLALVASCATGSRTHTEGEAPTWVPSCVEVNCLERTLEENYPIGTELTIERCAELAQSSYRYLRNKEGWYLVEIKSHRVDSCASE